MRKTEQEAQGKFHHSREVYTAIRKYSRVKSEEPPYTAKSAAMVHCIPQILTIWQTTKKSLSIAIVLLHSYIWVLPSQKLSL